MATRSDRAGVGVSFALEALEPRLLLSTKVLGGVPEYLWHHGCAPDVRSNGAGLLGRHRVPELLPR